MKEYFKVFLEKIRYLQYYEAHMDFKFEWQLTLGYYVLPKKGFLKIRNLRG